MKRFFKNLLTSKIAVLIAFIPTWIYIAARLLLSPDGFWQNFVLTGVAIYLLGGIQLILLCILIYFLVNLWEK